MDKSYYLFSSGTLKRKDNSLCLIKQDNLRTYIPIECVYDLYIFSDITLNSDLFDFLGSKSLSMHFFNYFGYYSGTYYPREIHISGNLLIKQVEHFTDISKRIIIAKKLVSGAGANILRNIKYYNSRGKDFETEIKEIDSLINCLDNSNAINEIMGIEGNIRRIYYSCWNTIINQDIQFNKRVKRPPDNMINSLISLLNSILYTKVITEIYKTQLNPSISYLHVPGTKRFSLALDVSEIFKPLIVDRLIFKLLNKRIVDKNDFVKEEGFLRLKPYKLKEIVKYLDDYMVETVKHRTLNRNVSYRHLIRLELYKLIKHLIGDQIYNPFKIWW